MPGCPAVAKVEGQAGNGPKPFAFELGNEIIVRLTLGATLRTHGCGRVWGSVLQEIKLRKWGFDLG